ncbi:MAG: hypothetical protein ABI837_01615 [Acidobacteriota bacterium]
MRNALAQLLASRPIHVTVDVQRGRKSEGRFANQQFTGSMTIDVVADEAGLHLTFPHAVMDRAEKEARERQVDPRKTQPTRSAINETQPTDIEDSLNFAPSMLRLLEVATKLSETRSMRDGRPVRVVVLKLTPKLPPEATSVWNVKFTEDGMTVWIGEDNLPVAADRVQRGSAGFMFIKGQMTNRHTWQFTHVGDRLVCTHEENSYAASGFGQRGEGRNVAILTVR